MNIEEENQAPTWLRQLRVTKIALVDEGANEHAQITCYKREESDLTATAESQTAIFNDIKKRAVRKFPTLTEAQAIDRYVTEIPEGQARACQHSEAVVDYEPEEIVTKVEAAGGNQAELIAKRLDDAAREYELLHRCGQESAYDHVLASSEGQQLRKRYDELVRG